MPAITYIEDTFTRTATGTGAGTAEAGADSNKTWVRSEGADADVNITGTALELQSGFGHSRFYVGDSHLDVEVYAEVDNFLAGDVNKEFTISTRRGTDDNDSVVFRWEGNGNLQIFRQRNSGPGTLGSIKIAEMGQARITSFGMRAQVLTVGAGTLCRMKYWDRSGGEPAQWMLSKYDTDLAQVPAGTVGIRGGNANGVIDKMQVAYVLSQSVDVGPQAVTARMPIHLMATL